MRAETTLVLGGVTLNVAYRTRNQMAFTSMQNLSLVEFLSKVTDNPEGFLSRHDILIDLLVAGLCHHKEWKSSNVEHLRDRICKLIDTEMDRNDLSAPEVLVKIGSALIPAVYEGVVPKAFADKQKANESETTEGPGGKNASAPAESAAIGHGTSSLSNA